MTLNITPSVLCKLTRLSDNSGSLPSLLVNINARKLLVQQLKPEYHNHIFVLHVEGKNSPRHFLNTKA